MDHTDYRDKYAIEHKSRKVVPNWIYDALDQAEAAMKQPWHIPVVIIHKDRTGMDDDLIVFQRKYFEERVDPNVRPPSREAETEDP